jgi:hypothetical protein
MVMMVEDLARYPIPRLTSGARLNALYEKLFLELQSVLAERQVTRSRIHHHPSNSLREKGQHLRLSGVVGKALAAHVSPQPAWLPLAGLP